MLIKNGLILSPDTGLQTRGDLRITDGIITEIETSGTLTPQPGEQVIDASSLRGRAGTCRYSRPFSRPRAYL